MPGKDCARQLASKALAKKSTNKSRSCKGKTLIETTAEAEDTLHQVTDTHRLIHCAPVHTDREKACDIMDPNQVVRCVLRLRTLPESLFPIRYA